MCLVCGADVMIDISSSDAVLDSVLLTVELLAFESSVAESVVLVEQVVVVESVVLVESVDAVESVVVVESVLFVSEDLAAAACSLIV